MRLAGAHYKSGQEQGAPRNDVSMQFNKADNSRFSAEDTRDRPILNGNANRLLVYQYIYHADAA